jgi:hypothetical protein
VALEIIFKGALFVWAGRILVGWTAANVRIEQRWTNADLDRTASLAKELIELKPEHIAATIARLSILCDAPEVPMSDNWYYAVDDGTVGPVTLRELKDALATFINPRDVHVWCAGFSDWKRAGDVEDLKESFRPRLPPKNGTSQPDNRGQMAKKGYVSRILQPGEHILSIGRLHWIIYIEAISAAVLSIVCFWMAKHFSGEIVEIGSWVFGLILLTASVLIAAKAWFDRWITEIAVTNRRVIYKRGFIRRHTVEMNMDKIESVTVTQSIVGRMLDYGTIHIRGTGIGLEHLHKIAAPLSLRNCITAR